MKTMLARPPRPSSTRVMMSVASVFGAFVGAMAAGSLFSSGPAVLIAAPTSSVLAALLVRSLLSRPIRLRVERNRLHGLMDAPIPLGEARVVVESWAERVKWIKGEPWRRYFRVRVRAPNSVEELTSRSLDAVGTRAFAEAIARAGRFPIRWMCDGEIEERAAPEVDVPLVDRLLQRPELLVAYDMPSGTDTIVEPTADGGVRLRWPFRRSYVVGTGSLALLVWLIVGLPAACQATSAGPGRASLLVGAGVLCFGTAALFLLISFLFPFDVVVGPERVSKRLLLLRMVPMPLWRIRTAAIESVYLEREPSPRVVFAGDGFFHGFSSRGLWTPEALHLRAVVQSAMTGGKVVPRPRTSGASAPAYTTTATPREVAPHRPEGEVCPKCCEPSLLKIGGPLDELACEFCGGRFLSPHGAERLLEHELGLRKDMLRTLVGFFAGERLSCPGCRSKTSPVRLKGVTADLCTGCGGLWLDAGELNVVSEGRYAEETDDAKEGAAAKESELVE